MLTTEHLTKSFATRNAVSDMSLTIPQGQMVGEIGRSGAGKSTLLRMINRLAEPTSGRVTFEGRDVTALKGRALHEWRATCAMVFQQFNLVGRLDVITNVLTGRLYRHGFVPSMLQMFSAAERAFAIRALDRLGMAHTADTLSGGQMQRVAIARALVQEPRVMLADEPIASLDPLNAKVVMDALRTINREDGISVICNLHTLDTARSYCDRIIGLKDGMLVFDDVPAKLTQEMAREIYGAEADDAFAEGLTSTSLGGMPAKERLTERDLAKNAQLGLATG